MQGNKITAIVPTNTNEVMQLSAVLSSSTAIPKSYVEHKKNIPVAIMHGMEIGLTPLQALNSIAIINGKPCLYGDAPLALVRSSGLLEYIQESVKHDDKGDPVSAHCKVKRRDEEKACEVTFTMRDAERAGLTGGRSGAWEKYPARMLQLRARSYCLRDTFCDVLLGITQAEVEDEDEVGASASAEAEHNVREALDSSNNTAAEVSTEVDAQEITYNIYGNNKILEYNAEEVLISLIDDVYDVDDGITDKSYDYYQKNKAELLRWKTDNPKYYKFWSDCEKQNKLFHVLTYNEMIVMAAEKFDKVSNLITQR